MTSSSIQLYVQVREHMKSPEAARAALAECSSCKRYFPLRGGLCMYCSGHYPQSCTVRARDSEGIMQLVSTCPGFGCSKCIAHYVNWGYFPRFNRE